ncbi:DNA-binding protein [Treponema endosymbiont of Eucomonympha sp.]|uniref:DNA-binding protein n=1 Tax=Treponema endosymbiont of Eucomonympha sp. TaxID=1580831 RepID=UPI00075136DF|nr:DNA-binding protein [Treponema endosymbiont of Eucomonympha sp.]
MDFVTPKTDTALPPLFYSLKQVSQLLGRSKVNISRLTKLDRLPCVRIGAYPYYAKAYIDGLVAQAMGTPAQRKTAASAAIEAFNRLINAASDYGEIGVILTLHAGGGTPRL